MKIIFWYNAGLTFERGSFQRDCMNTYRRLRSDCASVQSGQCLIRALCGLCHLTKCQRDNQLNWHFLPYNFKLSKMKFFFSMATYNMYMSLHSQNLYVVWWIIYLFLFKLLMNMFEGTLTLTDYITCMNIETFLIIKVPPIRFLIGK